MMLITHDNGVTQIRPIHRRIKDGDVRLTEEVSRLMLIFLYWRNYPSLLVPWDEGSLVFSVGGMSRRLGVSTSRVRDAVARLELLGLLRTVESGYKKICVLPKWPDAPRPEDVNPAHNP